MANNIKQVLRDIWEDKPLAITIVVAIAVVVYILYKHSKATVTAPASSTPASTTPPAAPGGTYVEESITYNITNPTQAPPPVTTPPPPVTTPPPPTTTPAYPAMTRLRGTGNPDYDRTAGGLPWGVPGGAIPYGVAVTVSSKTGDQNGKIMVTYQGQIGSMNVWDVNIPQ